LQWLVQQLQRVQQQQQQQLQHQAAIAQSYAEVESPAAYMAAPAATSQYSTPQKLPAGSNMYLSPSAAASPAAHRISNPAWGPGVHQHPQMSPRQTMAGWVWHDVGSPHPAVNSPAAVPGRQHTPRGTSSPLVTAGGSNAGAQISPGVSATTPTHSQPAFSPGRPHIGTSQPMQQNLLLSPTGAQVPGGFGLPQFSTGPSPHSSSGVVPVAGGSTTSGTLPMGVLGSPGPGPAAVSPPTQPYIVSPGPNGMLTLIPASSYLVPGQVVTLPPGSQIMTLATSPPGATAQVAGAGMPVGTVPGPGNVMLIPPQTVLGSPMAQHSGGLPLGMPGVGMPMGMGGMHPHAHHLHLGQPGTPRMSRPLYETSLTTAVVSVKHAGAPAVPPPAAGQPGAAGAGAGNSTVAAVGSSPQQQASAGAASAPEGAVPAPPAAASAGSPAVNDGSAKANHQGSPNNGAVVHSSHGSHGSWTHAPPTPTVSKVLVSTHNQSGRSSSNSSMTGPAALVVPSTPSASPHCPAASGRALLSPTTPSSSTAHDLQLGPAGHFGPDAKAQEGVQTGSQ
jgi:hypothetical protein